MHNASTGTTPEPREIVGEFARIGVTAFTTTRAAGDFGLGDGDPPPEARSRWEALAASIDPGTQQVVRLASAQQVHGARVIMQGDEWTGWRREGKGDGHWTASAGTACAIQIADCVPVFMAHDGGAVAIVHAGWRGTVARILAEGLRQFTSRSIAAVEVHVHLGPAICGRCYRVGPDVFEQLTGWPTARERNVDLRALLAEQARALGVRELSASAECTRCDNDRFFSHRAGDSGRQAAVIAAHPSLRAT